MLRFDTFGDGYTERGYIAAKSGLNGAVRFSFRPALEPIRVLNRRSVARQMQFESRSLKFCMEVPQWSSMSRQSFSRCPRCCGSGSIWCCRFTIAVVKVAGRGSRCGTWSGGILYVLWTGCQWKAMPSQFGSGSAIHAYFQEWVGLGVFEELWRLALDEYDELTGIDWKWQSVDGAMTKSPLGGEKNREKPDRPRQVGRQEIGALVDGRGVPLAVAVDGANVHDQKLLAPTLDGIPVERPEPEPYHTATSLPGQRLCREAR